jgi:hypothetical protein
MPFENHSNRAFTAISIDNLELAPAVNRREAP